MFSQTYARLILSGRPFIDYFRVNDLMNKPIGRKVVLSHSL